MGEATKKQMNCPVLGKRIKPAECGENRMSKYNCPADCEHNPWNPENYARALEIGDRFTEKMLARLRAEISEGYGYAKPPPFNENTDEFDMLAWFSNKFYREKDRNGYTFKQRWESEHLKGLNNDLKLILEAESKMRPCLLEIQQVPDDQSIIAVDLFEPEPKPFTLLDRSLAARACRFSTFFCMVYDMPHYSRIHSAGCPMPEVGGMPMLDVFMTATTHLKAPTAGDFSGWLCENLVLVVDSLKAIAMARNEAILRNLDTVYTKSIYDLRCTEKKFRDILKKQADIQQEEPTEDDIESGFIDEWVCISDENPTGAGPALVGRILLHEDGFIQLEASNRNRTEQLKQKMEALFGSMLRFSRERTDDLGKQMLAKRSFSYNPELVPAALINETPVIQNSVSQVEIPPGMTSKTEVEDYMFRKIMESFPDQEIPLLGGLTPRMAAKNQAARPGLLELMKSHIRSNDENNLRHGRNTDINWLLDELGLDEINFPPPPKRAPLAGVYEDPEDDYDDPVMIMEEQIDERSRELNAIKPAHQLKCFRIGYPLAHELLTEMIAELELEYAADELNALAARLVFQQMDPDPKPCSLFDGELLHDNLSDALDYMQDNGLEGYLASLHQPFMANLAITRLREILRGGENDPAFANCLIFLVALSEAIDEMVAECMLDLLGRMGDQPNPF